MAAGLCLTCEVEPTSDATVMTQCEAESDEHVPIFQDEKRGVKHEGGGSAEGEQFRQDAAKTPEMLLNDQVRVELEASRSRPARLHH